MVRSTPMIGFTVLVLGIVASPAVRAADTVDVSYPGAHELPLGESLAINGEPLRATYFVTSDPLPRVAAHYRRALAEAGLAISEVVAPAHVTLLGLTLGGEVRFSVNIHAQGDQTLVFPSRLAVERLIREPAAQPGSEIPVFPGAAGVTTLTARDAIGPTETVSYQDGASLARNVEYFKTEMTRRGWRREQKVAGTRGATVVLRFAKGRRSCTVGLTWDGASRKTQVTTTTSGGAT